MDLVSEVLPVLWEKTNESVFKVIWNHFNYYVVVANGKTRQKRSSLSVVFSLNRVGAQRLPLS